MRRVELTEEAYRVLCGLVQPTSEVDSELIFTDAWLELRTAFPITDWRPEPHEEVGIRDA